MNPAVVSSCSIPQCKKPYRAKGYCDVHYKKWRRGELPHSRYKTCYKEGCRQKVFKRAFCESHYHELWGKKKEIAPAAVPVEKPQAPLAEQAPAA